MVHILLRGGAPDGPGDGSADVPVAIYVDDVCVVAPTAAEANAEIDAFQRWTSALCGVSFKVSKNRRATTRGRGV